MKKLKLQSSYIFLENPDKKPAKQEKNNDENVIVLDLGKSVYCFIRSAFPDISENKSTNNRFKKEYRLAFNVGSVECTAIFIINKVKKITFLDIIVDGKSKAQAITGLEYIQELLLNHDMDDYYIPIISYDAISEYYCNKIFGKLNSLERNLRKLLFDIYIANFDVQYYEATITKEHQDEIKKNIKAKGGAKSRKAEQLKTFFYALDYGSLRKILFSPSWTEIDQKEKDKFLSENTDLSTLSDEELRNKFLKFTPKSDWERFFSEKIKIEKIEELIKDIGLYRNKVAHFKFFYKQDYDECDKRIRYLNKAVLNAIKITEDKDFTEKNAAYLESLCKDIAEKIKIFRKGIMESYKPIIDNVSKITQAFTEENKAIMEAVHKTQEFCNAINPSLSAFQAQISSTKNIFQSKTSQFDFRIQSLSDKIKDYSENTSDNNNIVTENNIIPEREDDNPERN